MQTAKRLQRAAQLQRPREARAHRRRLQRHPLRGTPKRQLRPVGAAVLHGTVPPHRPRRGARRPSRLRGKHPDAEVPRSPLLPPWLLLLLLPAQMALPPPLRHLLRQRRPRSPLPSPRRPPGGPANARAPGRRPRRRMRAARVGAGRASGCGSSTSRSSRRARCPCW